MHHGHGNNMMYFKIHIQQKLEVLRVKLREKLAHEYGDGKTLRVRLPHGERFECCIHPECSSKVL